MPNAGALADLHRFIDVGAFMNGYAIVLPVDFRPGAGRNQRLGLPVVDRTLGCLENAQHAQALSAVGTGLRARAHAFDEMTAFTFEWLGLLDQNR